MQHPILKVIRSDDREVVSSEEVWEPVLEGFRRALELAGPTGPDRAALARGYRLAYLLAGQDAEQGMQAVPQ